MTAILPHRCPRSMKDAVDESRKETADRVGRYQAYYRVGRACLWCYCNYYSSSSRTANFCGCFE